MARITMADSFDGVDTQGKPRRIANNTFQYTNLDGDTVIRHQQTDIITKHADGKLTLDSGGWRTVTTKDRLNKFAPVSVWSDKGTWMVSYQGKSAPFMDGMTLPDDLDNPQAWLDRSVAKILANKVNKFVKRPLSSMNDCDKCGETETTQYRKRGEHKGQPHMTREHAIGHLDDEVVPLAMMNAALLWAGYTDVAIYHMHILSRGDIGQRALRRYLRLVIGL